MAVEQHTPARRFDQAVDTAQQGGLAGTAQANHGHELAARHRKAYIAKRLHAAGVGFTELFDLKEWLHDFGVNTARRVHVRSCMSSSVCP